MTEPPLSFRATLDAALKELEAGPPSPERLEEWTARLREAAQRELGDPLRAEDQVRFAFETIYRRLVDQGKVVRYVPGVPRYTIEMVKPKLRAELDRRVAASVDLIKYNRAEAVDRTVRRFAGWASAVPPGGAEVDLTEARKLARDDLAKYKYHRRLVQNDQGHKLIANVSEITAAGAGAVAGKWNSHFRDASYDARRDHAARDGKYYVLRDSWAYQQGLITKGAGFYDEITAAGEEINCRCWVTWVSSLRNLPPDMLTTKGREWVKAGDERARRFA